MVYITGDTHGDPERLSKSALKNQSRMGFPHTAGIAGTRPTAS